MISKIKAVAYQTKIEKVLQYFYYNNSETVTRSPLGHFIKPLTIPMLRSPQVTKIRSSVQKNRKNILLIFDVPRSAKLDRKPNHKVEICSV